MWIDEAALNERGEAMHRHFKSVAAATVLLGILTLLSAPARAQLSVAELQTKLVGTWLTTVEGEPRKRNLVIEGVTEKSDGTHLMTGTFFFTDIKPVAFKGGEVRQVAGKVEIVFVTGADSVYTATQNPDGSFTGSTKYKNGRVKPITIEKAAAVAAAAPVTEFDGKWSGNAYSSAGQQCVNGVYDISVKDGKVSGTATFNSRLGAAVSTVTGEVKPDKSMALRLVKQQQYGRTTRFQAKFEDGSFVAADPVVSGGQCSYDVKLKKDS